MPVGTTGTGTADGATRGGAGAGPGETRGGGTRVPRLRVTPRDRALCETLREHGVLTGTQLGALHFAGLPRQSRTRRLGELVDWGLLRRFRPGDDVTRPWHYVLTSSGARAVLHQRGWRTPAPSESYLPHRLAANDFFIAVLEAVRAREGWRLAEWLGERGCRQRWSQAGLVPDGYGVLEAPDGVRVSWFLEVDLGTEGMALLLDKARAYRRLDERAPVLFCLNDELRARRLLSDLAERDDDLPVATATLEQHHADPLGPIWRLRGHQGGVSLLDLGAAVGASRAEDGP